MFTVPQAAAVQRSGSFAAPHLACGWQIDGVRSLHVRGWRGVQTFSLQDSSAGDGGSTATEKSPSGFSKEFATYTEIQNVASRHCLLLRLETVGPFFRVRVFDSDSKEVLGAAQGLVKIWTSGRILHLDSVRFNRSSLKAKRPIFGIAFLLGAVAVRHGYDQNCGTAELLAIKDTDTYHSKLVRYYSRMGFRRVYEVTGESLQDIPHLLIWGGVGTRMDASIEELLWKWSPALKKGSQ